MQSDHEHDLIRALAIRLQHTRDIAARLPNEEAALALLHQVHDRCHCGAPTERSGRTTRCAQGHRRSLIAATFRHTKLPIRLWLTAIWHLHVDDHSVAARVFARRHRIDKMAAWRLLKRVRSAFILFASRSPASRSQTLGRQSEANAAFCLASIDQQGLLTVLDERTAKALGPFLPAGRPHPLATLVVGYFRDWLSTTFRGISERYHDEYLAEFADRQRRGRAFRYPWTALARDVRHSAADGRH
jgi:hypothetical protein